MSRIVIDENRCKGCGLCTTICPFDLIHMADRFNAKGYRPAEYTERCPADELRPADKTHPTDAECTGCANCATMCPDVAITVYRSGRSTSATYRIHAKTEPLQAGQTRHQADALDNRGNGNRGQQRQNIERVTGAHES